MTARLVRAPEAPRHPRRRVIAVERDRDRLRHPQQQQVDERNVHLHGGALDLGHLVALPRLRSEEHTSELQSLMRISYAVFCLKKKKIRNISINTYKPFNDQHTHTHDIHHVTVSN